MPFQPWHHASVRRRPKSSFLFSNFAFLLQSSVYLPRLFQSLHHQLFLRSRIPIWVLRRRLHRPVDPRLKILRILLCVRPLPSDRHIHRARRRIRVIIHYRPSRPVAPRTQHAPPAFIHRNLSREISRVFLVRQKRLHHFPVANNFQVLHRHDRPQPRGEGNCPLRICKLQFIAYPLPAQRELHQRPVRRKRSPLPNPIHPRSHIRRPFRRPHVRSVKSDLPPDRRRIIRRRVRSSARRQLESQIQQLVPHLRRRLVIAEPHNLHVVQFSQCHVHRQLVRNLLRWFRKWIGHTVERMHRSHQRSLRVRHVVDIRVHWIQARRRRPRIARIPRQKQMLLYLQHAAVSPIARVKLLPLHQHRFPIPGLNPRRHPKILVRNPLFLVHDQLVDYFQPFRLRLPPQMTRIIPVCPCVIHVHMQVRSHPVSLAGLLKIDRLQLRLYRLRLSSFYLHRRFKRLLAHPPRNPHLHFSRRRIHHHLAILLRIKIVRLKRLFLPVECIVRNYPCVIRRVESPLLIHHRNPRKIRK